MSAKLLDVIKEEEGLKSDADLARLLNVQPPVISNIRKGTASVGATMILRIYDETGMSVNRIRKLAAEK
jgi:plasmid maintenance system antidote protein VapI